MTTTTRKRLEAMKEKLTERHEALKDRRDDMVTIEEIGVDQVIVDELRNSGNCRSPPTAST